MDLATAVGYGAATLVFLTFATRTMVPLRAIGIASNVAFIAYGWLQPAPPILILHSILLPLNGFRLHQMLRLTRQVAAASRGDLNLDWLKPFGARRRLRAGELLYTKGAAADRMALVLGGSFLVRELGVEIGAGQAVGELGLVAPDGTRTRTVECVEPGDVLEVTYDQVRQLYFQNPAFGFYFLELTARRLFDTISRYETAIVASGRPAEPGGPGVVVADLHAASLPPTRGQHPL